MSKDPTNATTGYINNGGVLTLGRAACGDAFDTIALDRPQRPLRLVVEGDMPTWPDTAPISISIYDGTVPLVSAVGTWAVQGQSSVGAAKSNLKLKLRNPTTGNKLALKIGDWSPSNKITLKGYGTDRTLIRETTATALWRQIHAYPGGLMAPEDAYQYWDKTDLGMHMAAPFSTDGFPCELWRNGTFQQLCVWRSRTSNDDFLMDGANRKHILMQPQHALNIWSRDFDSRDWTVQSPDIADYVDQTDITTLAPDVQDACDRLFEWVQTCVASGSMPRRERDQHLHLKSWLDYIILMEVTGSYDSMQNNLFLGTWDARRWGIWPFDLDRTFGLSSWQSTQDAAPDRIGWVMRNGTQGDQDPGVFDVIHQTCRPELRARWAELRAGGVITMANITAIVRGQVGFIDPTTMVADLDAFPRYVANTLRDSVGTDGRWSVSYVLDWARGRIAWMDTQWGFNGHS